MLISLFDQFFHFGSALLVIFRNKIAYIFNTDPEVVVEVGKVTIYVAAFQVSVAYSYCPDIKCSCTICACRSPMVLSVLLEVFFELLESRVPARSST
jgi:hypothetical protein